MTAEFDHEALVRALEFARSDRGLSWRQVAAEANLDPSTLVRIAGGRTPDLARFAALVDWLGLPADSFLRRDGVGQPDLVLADGTAIFVKYRTRKPLSTEQLVQFRAATEAVLKAMDTD